MAEEVLEMVNDDKKASDAFFLLCVN